MQEVFVGVDVAKHWVDIHHPGRGSRRIENTPAAVRTFAAASAKVGLWIVFEASGGYDRLLRDALEAHGVRPEVAVSGHIWARVAAGEP